MSQFSLEDCYTEKERELVIQLHDTINFHLFSTPIDPIKAVQQNI
jgi:hypothetical protein